MKYKLLILLTLIYSVTFAQNYILINPNNGLSGGGVSPFDTIGVNDSVRLGDYWISDISKLTDSTINVTIDGEQFTLGSGSGTCRYRRRWYSRDTLLFRQIKQSRIHW